MGGRLPVGEERMYSRRVVTLAICLVLAACGGAPQAPTATTAASAPPAAAATATPLVPVAVKAAFTNLTGDRPPTTAVRVERGVHTVYDLAAQELATAQTGIVVQSSFLTTEREAMQRYVDSLVEAVSFMKKNKAQTVTIMKKYFNAPATAKGFEEAIDFYGTEALAALPYPKPELFAAAQETLGASNDAVKKIDVKTIVDDSFVKSAADRGLDKKSRRGASGYASGRRGLRL